jgi:hypothetical protein
MSKDKKMTQLQFLKAWKSSRRKASWTISRGYEQGKRRAGARRTIGTSTVGEVPRDYKVSEGEELRGSHVPEEANQSGSHRSRPGARQN